LCRHRQGALKESGRAQDESGFTLIELLIVMVILPIIFGGITIAIITSLHDDVGVSARLADSHDNQISSAYFARDVESAQAVSTSTGAGSLLCGNATGFSQLLGLSWTPSGSNVPIYVSYGIFSYPSPSNSPPVLMRRRCGGSSPGCLAI
jgi:prepilin-type N-terminal cleavage/methylation domain-containing protein